MTPEFHPSDDDLLPLARMERRPTPTEREHLKVCQRCQSHIEWLAASVEAAWAADLEEGGFTPETARGLLRRWLLGDALSGIEEHQVRDLLAMPAGAHLVARIGTELLMLGASFDPDRARRMRVTLPPLEEVLDETELAILGLSGQVKPAPVGNQGEASPPKMEAGQPETRRHGLRQWLDALWPRFRLTPMVWGLVGAAAAGLLIFRPGSPPTEETPVPFVSRGGESPTGPLLLEPGIYRQAPDGVWDKTPHGLHQGELPSCRPEDVVRLVVKGEGTGFLSVWPLLEGKLLEPPWRLGKMILNQTRVELFRPGIPLVEEFTPEAMVRVPASAGNLEVVVVFSAEPPPEHDAEGWLKNARASSFPAVGVASTRCRVTSEP